MSPKKSEAEPAAAKAPSLTKQYRAIGPAAIVAALICTPKKEAGEGCRQGRLKVPARRAQKYRRAAPGAYRREARTA